MKEYSNSIFWKIVAIAFVISIFYLGWSISHRIPDFNDFILTSAQAQTKIRQLESGEYILTTNQDGNVLYAYGFEPNSPTNAPPRLKETLKFEAH